ncbi:MAG: Omp28-related outer membrane protein [Flavobacteriaceae bacterium]|nr:Omp28-related outer membrane protein [Flavobacteriaceae bacterium]
MKKIQAFLIVFIVVLFTKSCSEKYETVSGESFIFITINGSSKIVGSETQIRVFSEKGEELTDDSQIYVNEQVIEGNTFVTDEVGVYEIKANYFETESEPVSVQYHDESEIFFKKRVLVEDYTGTWCGWCPRLSHAMKLVDEVTNDDVVFIAIHRAPTGTSDPYNYVFAEELEQMINTPGYPKGFINRIHQWKFPEPLNINQVIEFSQNPSPKLGLALNSEIIGNDINLVVKGRFEKDYQDLKVVVQLLENGLIWPQVNYTEYYNGDNPIENYRHDYTLRKTITDILGDEIPNSLTVEGSNWQEEYTIEIPEVIENQSQLQLVAFIVNNNNEVVNVRQSYVGEVQEFEIEQ